MDSHQLDTTLEDKLLLASIEILGLCVKLEVMPQDLMIVFGGILRAQSETTSKATGIPLDKVQYEFLRRFSLGLAGILENKAPH
jgi:hypothetical protein